MVAKNLEPAKHKFNIFLNLLAAIFLIVAGFTNWWTQYGSGEPEVQFDIWTAVTCVEGVCLASSNTSGWINFVRLTIIVGLTCFTAILFAQCLYQYKPKREFRAAILLFSSIAGGSLTITGFVITGFFGGIGNRYNTHTKRLTLDPLALRFHSLPLGFIFLSAFISCCIAVFTLVNIEPKKKKRKNGEYEMAPIKQINEDNTAKI